MAITSVEVDTPTAVQARRKFHTSLNMMYAELRVVCER